MDPLALEQTTEKFHGRRRVPTLLDQDVETLICVVGRTPQPHPAAIDLHHNLVEAPAAGRHAAPAADVAAISDQK
jgi:hypothetical protein